MTKQTTFAKKQFSTIFKARKSPATVIADRYTGVARGLEFDGGSYWFPKATRVKPDKIKSMKYGEYMVEEGDKPGNFVLRPSVVITSI